jgi:hypothetical protein
VIFGCPHTTGSSTVAALSAGQLSPLPDQPGNDLRLECQ